MSRACTVTKEGRGRRGRKKRMVKCSSCKNMKPSRDFKPIIGNGKTVKPKTCQLCRSRRTEYYWSIAWQNVITRRIWVQRSTGTGNSSPIQTPLGDPLRWALSFPCGKGGAVSSWWYSKCRLHTSLGGWIQYSLLDVRRKRGNSERQWEFSCCNRMQRWP